MHVALQAGIGSGLLESFAQVASIAGAVVLLGLLVAFGSFAYKSLRGDGIRWPDDVEDDGSVSRNSDDDEWKYS